jgi:hypothetical protein
MGFVKSELDKTHLPDDIQKLFEELIDESIDIAYCEYEEEPFSIAASPFDGAHARHFLTEMWGELITQGAIDAACERFENNYAEAIEDDRKAHAGE